MSALGHKRTCAVQKVMSALPPKADMCSGTSACPLCANSGHSAVRHFFNCSKIWLGLYRTALVQGSVRKHVMAEPFNFIFQMGLAAPEFDEHLAVVIRAMEQCLVDLGFEALKISNEGWVRHVVLHEPG